MSPRPWRSSPRSAPRSRRGISSTSTRATRRRSRGRRLAQVRATAQGARMANNFADPRDRSFIADANSVLQRDIAADYSALGTMLQRRGVDIDAVTNAVANFGVAI